MQMQFKLTMINETLEIAEADALQLMRHTNNDTWSIKYTGQASVLISSKQTFMYSINVKTTDIILVLSQPWKQSQENFPYVYITNKF